ncbi:unnamed protein product [Mytilus coruscus]|uniref:Uncharacterized protein n=1 Tax=Mytilus coruscus TaxID=42192 RepID=A0A6J8EAT1_MYTCO|nr:unnamed protein product [Mytilus coruscus]
MIEKEFDSIGEYINFWLDNIHCNSRDNTDTSGQYIENSLYYNSWNWDRQTFSADDKQEFKSLREDIFRYATVLSTWGDNLQTRWIVLEKEINRKLPEPVISYSDAQNLEMKGFFQKESQMTLELNSFLKFEHDIGNIIFFEDVKSFIVLDPTWLMDIFRCFVSHQYTNESIGMPEWGELEQTGKLSDRLIAKLLEKVRGLSSRDHK